MGRKDQIVICFIGTDGSGKSTLIKEVSKRYNETFKINTHTLYFGWIPYLPTTKIFSKLFQKRGYKITSKMNKQINNSKNTQKKKIDLIQECMFSYYFIEYFSKFLMKVSLRKLMNSKNELILIDRYFYDIYAHYDYAPKSKIFPILLKFFPKPDITFFLHAPLVIARQRKPEMKIELLKNHLKKYTELTKKLNLISISTNQDIQSCVNKIIININGEVRKKRS